MAVGQQNIINKTVSVGNSNVEVSPELLYGQRYSFVAVNTSTGGQVITLSWGQQAVSGRGIVLYPGGTHSESYDSAFIPANSRIFGIADAASGTLAVQERTVSKV